MLTVKNIATLVLVGVLLGTAFVLGEKIIFSSNKQTLTQQVVSSTTQKDLFPAIVRLTIDNRTFCSGSVISDTMVLTAAHCVVSKNPSTGDIDEAPEFQIVSLPKADLVVTSEARVLAFNLKQDTAIVEGDFRRFSKLKLETDPNNDILIVKPNLSACGFPYGGDLVCYKLTDFKKMIDVIGAKGQMYAGMSGGPVIDLDTKKVYAVNHAVTIDLVLVAPIVNLFDGMGLK